MKNLHKILNESIINEDILSEKEIDNIINDYFRKKNFNLVWSTAEVFRYTKVLVSRLRKADIIDEWSECLNPENYNQKEIEETLEKSFAIFTVHPDWTLKNFVAYEESGVKHGDPFNYNEYHYEYLLNKILAKYPD